MESVLHELNRQEAWREYFEYKLAKDHFTEKEKSDFADFIDQKKYERTVAGILNNEGLSIPAKKLINKIGGKKRAVYSFRDDENRVLKLLSYLLYRYDGKQSSGCYSFRKGFGVQKALHKIINTPDISALWSYKLDIKNYFNSISVPILLAKLEDVIDDDKLLYQFLCRMLSENRAAVEDEVVEENRGAMAGTPTSPFFANIYLREMDEYFIRRGVLYVRYSDDIIVFAKTQAELAEYKNVLHGFLSRYELSVNPEKEKTTGPMQAWEYLGVEYQSGRIDLCSATKQKIKGKIKRKARALYRWKLKKNAGDDQTMRVMIRIFNRKFFENRNPHDLTWSRWFFPIVTEKDGLQEIDAYMQQYIRYIATGSHGKKNYKVTYEMLKELGYRSLVNEYYKYKSRRQCSKTGQE
jgi:Retron-type reverse transcriptase